MIVRPAGYSSSEDESGDESGYSESSGDPSTSKTSLQDAIENSSLENIKQLLTDINDYQNFELPSGYSPFTYAASIGKSEILNFFLNYGNDQNIYDSDRLTMKYEALMAICSTTEQDFNEGHLQCIDLLLNSGIQIGEKDRYGVNVLMTACKCAAVEVVEMLLSKNCPINEVDNNGWSPLFYAANRGNVNIVTSLLKHGADINIVDKRDRYPFTIANDKGFSQISLLLKPEAITKLETSDDGDILPFSNSKTMNFDDCDVNYYEDALAVLCAAAPEMSRYTRVVREKRVGLRQLLLVKTEDQLRSTGIIFSLHRKTILRRIREFHLGCWSPNSFGLENKIENLEQCTLLAVILTFVATLNRQLLVLRTTFEYTEDAILNPDQISCNVIDILKAIKTCLMQIKLRLIYLRQHINAIKDNTPPFLHAQQL